MRSPELWRPPESWMSVSTLDCHTEGEPLRVITAGFPAVHGETMVARRRYMKMHRDSLRTALMWEPRGHADMYGCLITPPVSETAHFGVLFMHNEGYSTMCGHGIIGVVTVVLETGMLPMVAPVSEIRIDTPAGMVTAYARVEGGRVRSVYFHNVASFALAMDEKVHVPGLGDVRYDLAFGGAFYAYVDADTLSLTLGPESFRDLIERGMAIKREIMKSRPVSHPFEDELSFLYGTIFTGHSSGEGVQSRHVCVFAEGEVDRSPTGTGVSGRLAILHARGEIGLNQPVVIESIIGSSFTGRVKELTQFGHHPAVIPEVEGSAHITGRHEFFIDPVDPFRNGFVLR